jgi:AcrR family transcriptional regulator
MRRPASPIAIASPPRRRGRPPTAGLRQRILRAAESAFLRHDFHEVRMDDVAVASGVGKGTLYRYFGSKEALFTALLLDGLDLLRHELSAAVEGASDPVVRLERMVRATLAHLQERRFLFALIYRREHKPTRAEAREWERRRMQLARVVEDAVREGVTSGALRPVEPRIAAEALLGLLRAADRSRRTGDSLDALGTEVFELFLCGAASDRGRQGWRSTRPGAPS